MRTHYLAQEACNVGIWMFTEDDTLGRISFPFPFPPWFGPTTSTASTDGVDVSLGVTEAELLGTKVDEWEFDEEGDVVGILDIDLVELDVPVGEFVGVFVPVDDFVGEFVDVGVGVSVPVEVELSVGELEEVFVWVGLDVEVDVGVRVFVSEGVLDRDEVVDEDGVPDWDLEDVGVDDKLLVDVFVFDDVFELLEVLLRDLELEDEGVGVFDEVLVDEFDLEMLGVAELEGVWDDEELGVFVVVSVLVWVPVEVPVPELVAEGEGVWVFVFDEEDDGDEVSGAVFVVVGELDELVVAVLEILKVVDGEFDGNTEGVWDWDFEAVAVVEGVCVLVTLLVEDADIDVELVGETVFEGEFDSEIVEDVEIVVLGVTVGVTAGVGVFELVEDLVEAVVFVPVLELVIDGVLELVTDAVFEGVGLLVGVLGGVEEGVRDLVLE